MFQAREAHKLPSIQIEEEKILVITIQDWDREAFQSPNVSR